MRHHHAAASEPHDRRRAMVMPPPRYAAVHADSDADDEADHLFDARYVSEEEEEEEEEDDDHPDNHDDDAHIRRRRPSAAHQSSRSEHGDRRPYQTVPTARQRFYASVSASASVSRPSASAWRRRCMRVASCLCPTIALALFLGSAALLWMALFPHHWLDERTITIANRGMTTPDAFVQTALDHDGGATAARWSRVGSSLPFAADFFGRLFGGVGAWWHEGTIRMHARALHQVCCGGQ
jgi:hypothetical protein